MTNSLGGNTSATNGGSTARNPRRHIRPATQRRRKRSLRTTAEGQLKSVNGNSGVSLNVVVKTRRFIQMHVPDELQVQARPEAATSSFRFGGLDCNM